MKDSKQRDWLFLNYLSMTKEKITKLKYEKSGFKLSITEFSVENFKTFQAPILLKLKLKRIII